MPRTMCWQIETAKGGETFLDFLMVAEETFEDGPEGQGGTTEARTERCMRLRSARVVPS
jgi:hypothetical protein